MELSAGLKAAGVLDLFDFSKANFSNMVKEPKPKMAITSILQSTKIQVKMQLYYTIPSLLKVPVPFSKKT